MPSAKREDALSPYLSLSAESRNAELARVYEHRLRFHKRQWWKLPFVACLAVPTDGPAISRSRSRTTCNASLLASAEPAFSRRDGRVTPRWSRSAGAAAATILGASRMTSRAWTTLRWRMASGMSARAARPQGRLQQSEPLPQPLFADPMRLPRPWARLGGRTSCPVNGSRDTSCQAVRVRPAVPKGGSGAAHRPRGSPSDWPSFALTPPDYLMKRRLIIYGPRQGPSADSLVPRHCPRRDCRRQGSRCQPGHPGVVAGLGRYPVHLSWSPDQSLTCRPLVMARQVGHSGRSEARTRCLAPQDPTMTKTTLESLALNSLLAPSWLSPS